MKAFNASDGFSAGFVIAQLFGILGMAALFLSYQQKKRERLILGKLGADIMWVIHYLLLGATGGAIPNFVGIFRELVFIQREKRGLRSFLWPLLFIGVNWVIALTTWQSALTLLPIGASTFVTLSLWVRSPRLTRLIGVPVSVCFLIYDVCVGSYIGILNEVVALVSIVIAMGHTDRHIASERTDNTNR